MCHDLDTGPHLNTPGVTLKQDTATALIEAMQGTGVSRLVSLGASSINPKSLEGQSWAWRWCGPYYISFTSERDNFETMC
jgi:hypothetical protein